MMYRVFLWALTLCCLAAESYADDASLHSVVQLTSQESEFLATHNSFKYCVDPSWMPYEQINRQGQHEGLTADYIRLLSSILDIDFELFPTVNWQQSIEAAKTRACDLLPLAAKNQQRSLFLDFVEPYISYPSVIATPPMTNYLLNVWKMCWGSLLRLPGVTL